MSDQIHNNDFLKQRLDQHESPVPHDMFDRIQQTRETRLDTSSLKERLDGFESVVPTDMFDRLIHERDNRLKEPELQERLSAFESAVPLNLFDRIANERESRITNEDIQPSFEERLTHYESVVPSDMFERIMAERDDRKPVIAWWQTARFRWSIAALLFLLVINTIVYQALKTPINVVSTPNNQQNTSHRDKEGGNFKTEKPEISTNSDNTTAVSSEMSSQYNVPNKNIEKPEPTQSTAAAVSAKATKKQNSNIHYQNPNSDSKAASNSAIITSNLEQQNSNLILNTHNTTLNSVQHDYNPITIDPETTTNNAVVVSPLKGLLTEGVAVSVKALPAMPCLGPDNGCPTFAKNGTSVKALYVDIYGAPEHGFRSLKALSNEFDYYRNARDTVEKSAFSWSAGTRASVVFNSGFAIRAGIVYAQNHEIFRKDSAATGNIEWTIIERPNGVRDTISKKIEEGFYRQTRHNYTKTWDLTLQLGYEMSLTDQLSLGINAGANINLSTKIKGTILNKELQGAVISTSNTPYNSSVGVSLVGSIAAYWALTDRLQVFVEPQVRYYLKPITKNPDYQLRQHYTNVGLALGVRYRLNQPTMRVY